MADLHHEGMPMVGTTRGEGVLYSLLSGVTFAVLLTAAVMACAIGLGWRGWLPGAQACTSLFDGVKAAVNSVVPLMFMA